MTGVQDDQLAQLVAKMEITEALAAYCRAMDRIDVELARSVFHPDAIADYGAMFTGSGYGFVDFIATAHPALESHVHHLGAVAVTVDGDEAGSEAYVMSRLRSRSHEGGYTDFLAYGRYVDRWKRIGGVWRISHRRYLHTMDDTQSVAAAVFPTGGTRDRNDPGYEVLGPGA